MISEKDYWTLVKPSIIGYLMDNQGKKTRCRVTTDEKGYIVFYPVVEECDCNDHD